MNLEHHLDLPHGEMANGIVATSVARLVPVVPGQVTFLGPVDLE